MQVRPGDIQQGEVIFHRPYLQSDRIFAIGIYAGGGKLYSFTALRVRSLISLAKYEVFRNNHFYIFQVS